MFAPFYYIIGIAVAGVVFTLGFVLSKKTQKFYVYCKIFSITLAIFFVLRYMSGASSVDYISQEMYALNGLFGSYFLNFLALILVWFTYVSNVLLSLYGFFKIGRINKYIKYISFPIVIANILFMNFHFTAIIGENAISTFSLRGLWFSLEIGVALGYVAFIILSKILLKLNDITTIDSISKETQNTESYEYEIFEKYHKREMDSKTGFKKFFAKVWYGITVAVRVVKKFFKKYWFDVFAVLVLFFSCFPSYGMWVLFGKAHQVYKTTSFEIPHRILLYIGIILPFIMHFSIKNRKYEERKFYLLFICLGTLITYSFTKRFDAWTDMTSWPLHLCNTAMYIMPIVLMFNMKRFFYFTYFINVIGAFFAMLMPNYSSTSNIFSPSLVNFYVNHYIAFFMPLLFVSLGMFEKPKLKQFVYSMLGFMGYFVLVIVVNAVFTGMFEAGMASKATDFFFVNSDFIAGKLGNWAERLRDVTAVINVGNIKLTFYPIYQILFFLVYVLLGLAIWFIYAQSYQIADTAGDMRKRKEKIHLEQLALMSAMNGRSLKEPKDMENQNKLILKNFTKRYGNSDVLAVDNANLEVNGGEIFGFLGPNGAGKSTIIKTVVGIQPITSGQVLVCGYDINSQSIESKRCIGFVPDHYALYEKLTGREYINYIADLYNVPKKERDERIESYVARFELSGAFDNQMKTYSHGMKQKIAIMAALVHDPKVWILDEPLTGLDPNSIYQVKECMKERAREGNIVFFSSHIIDVVERICDRIAIIKKGKIITTKSVKEIEESGISLEDFYMKTINEEN